MSTPLVISFTLISRALWTLSEVYVFQSLQLFMILASMLRKLASNFGNNDVLMPLILEWGGSQRGGGWLDSLFIVRKKGNPPLQFWPSWKKVALFDYI